MTEDLKSFAWRAVPWLLDSLIGICLWIQVGMISDIKAIRAEVQSLKEFRAAAPALFRQQVQSEADWRNQRDENTRIWQAINEGQKAWLRDLGEIKLSVAEIKAELRIAKKAVP